VHKLDSPALRRALPHIERASLKPVFHTDIERTTIDIGSNGALVELAFDRGEVLSDDKRESIYEVEAELKQGDDVGLLYAIGLELQKHARLQINASSKAQIGYQMLRSTLQPPSRSFSITLGKTVNADEAFRQLVQQSMTQMLVNQPAATAGTTEGVHELRIGIRRLRTALRLFRECIELSEYDALTKELRWLGREVGEARDWDVFATRLLPLYLHDEMVLDTVTELRHLAHQRAGSVLRSARYARLMLSMGHWLESGDWRRTHGHNNGAIALDQPIKRSAAAMLTQAAQRVFKAGKQVDQLSVSERHALRKQAKKLRYSVEFLTALYPEEEVAHFLKRLKKVLRLLGAQ
jgi:inorganic triphosphatase YgiF